MEVAEVHQQLDVIAAFDPLSADLGATKAGLAAVHAVRGWLDARMLAMTSRLAVVSTFPENDLAVAGRTGQRCAAAILKRAETVVQMPALGAALAAGTVSVEHLDVATRGLRRLKPADRPEFIAQSSRLALLAGGTTPEEFEQTVQHETDRITARDGTDLLTRQKRATRVRSWIDKATGMWCLNGRYDPQTGVTLQARIDAMLTTKFADRTPDGCPDDPSEKQDWLRAHALAALLQGDRTGGTARPEVVIVIDTTRGTVRWPYGAVLPDDVLQKYLSTSTIHWVDIHCGNIVYAPGQLNLGRTTRLANRAQRRALGALYATCAIPGCNISYENTKLHHLLWWRHGGTTDLCNLLPLCNQHHHAVHETGWIITLATDRSLTLTLPDNTIMTTGPPNGT